MRAEEIERRLRRYLERDRSGVRKALISILLNGEKYSTGEIHDLLKSKGFQMNSRSVSAMVGLMNARLGILKVDMGEKNLYYLKKEYQDLVRRIFEEYDKKSV